MLPFDGVIMMHRKPTVWIVFKQMAIILRKSDHALCGSEYENGMTPYWRSNQTRCIKYPDSMVHGANMGLIGGRQDPGGSHVGHMNFAIWVLLTCCQMNHITVKYKDEYVDNRHFVFIQIQCWINDDVSWLGKPCHWVEYIPSPIWNTLQFDCSLNSLFKFQDKKINNLHYQTLWWESTRYGRWIPIIRDHWYGKRAIIWIKEHICSDIQYRVRLYTSTNMT